MKVGDENALEVGMWWARSHSTSKLTIIRVYFHEWAEEDDDCYGKLYGVVMGKDYDESVEELMHPRGLLQSQYGYTFIERIQEPAKGGL